MNMIHWEMLRKLITADGAETKYNYDELGNIINITDALGNNTTYSYNDKNQVTVVKDAKGNKSKPYSYDK